MGRNRHSPSNSIHHSHRPPPLSLDPSTGVLLPAAKRSTAPPLVVEPVIAPVNNRGTSFPPALSIRPPTKAESTRVQLQRQRLREQHAAVVVSQRLPGLKTSTAFFASLRTNLRLNASPPPSPLPTPPPTHVSTFPPFQQPYPSPLSQDSYQTLDSSTTTSSIAINPPPGEAPTHLTANMVPPPPSSSTTQSEAAQFSTTTTTSSSQSDPLAGVPELTTYTATTPDDQTAALRLIADSVAQQRQTSNNALITHPLHLPILFAILAVIGRVGYFSWFNQDVMITALTCTGIVMGYLLLWRWMTQGYLGAAEKVDGEWLEENGDEVVVTRFGNEVIGAAVLGFVPENHNNGHGPGSGNSHKRKGSTQMRGLIRAWTVRLKYRGKGVGGALLEEAAKIAKSKGVDGLSFAKGEEEGGVHSAPILPTFYSNIFNKRDAKARQALENAIATASPTKSRRKRGGSS